MSDNNNSASTGFPVLVIMFLIFLTLKLAEIGTVATWSWWAVTAPLWGGALALLALFICVALFAAFK